MQRFITALGLFVAAPAFGLAPGHFCPFGEYDTVLSFTEDLHFGRTRQKTFCGGEEIIHRGVGLWKHCCDLHLGLWNKTSNITLSARESYLVAFTRQTLLVIDYLQHTTITCGTLPVTAARVRRAFGTHVRIDRVEGTTEDSRELLCAPDEFGRP